ncbi:MAG TPA: YciI family protein [Paraburkholderia sp.]|nr:YciI family protein [Paraburkholderia sp.]
MYVINLIYTAPRERVDDALEAHRAFLARWFDAGVFVVAGPKVPRAGGIILAAQIERDRLDDILASDPFAEQKLARYEVTEFKATRLAPGLNLPMPDSDSSSQG